EGKHAFNDLVVRKNGDVIVTDSLENRVYRFNRRETSLSHVAVNRPLISPSGVALAEDDRTLFVADVLGVSHVDLASGRSRDVAFAEGTLAGIDGLYWHRGSLIAIQNGMGLRRLMIFRLTGDGSRVASAEVLENRTALTELPTKGAIVGDDFYFI